MNKNLLINKKANSIIWAGRHIPLKHLEDLLVAVSRLKKKGYRFSLSVIGDGQKTEEWQHLSRKLGVENEVLFMGSMPSHSVRDEMKKAQIFVSTSDFNEGWGAVINEGMNSVCVPVVSHAMGASAFLIKNGQNGFIYKSGDVTSLEKCLMYLLDHSDTAKEMAISAYRTIVEEYNGAVAAERLLYVSKCLLNGKAIPTYLTGPMSLSPLLKNNWIKRVIE